jgi:hypothetical protein
LIDPQGIAKSPEVVTTPPISSESLNTGNPVTAAKGTMQSTSSNFAPLQAGRNSNHRTDGLDTLDWMESDDEPD